MDTQDHKKPSEEEALMIVKAITKTIVKAIAKMSKRKS
jgi:hypothetical protein